MHLHIYKDTSHIRKRDEKRKERRLGRGEKHILYEQRRNFVRYIAAAWCEIVPQVRAEGPYMLLSRVCLRLWALKTNFKQFPQYRIVFVFVLILKVNLFLKNFRNHAYVHTLHM